MQIDFNGLAAADPIPGFVRMPFDADGSGTIQQLDLGSRQVFEALRKKDIQAEPPVFRTGLELHFG